jgi:hypothetical protein
MLDGFSEKTLVSIFVILFVAGVYFMGKLFSCANEQVMTKYRFLGPWALMIPGALNRRGWVYLLAFLGVMAALFFLSMHMFDFDELL